MEATYRKFEEWGQFDRYCKLVLYHEAIDYLRELQRLRNNEVSLEVLSPAQWDKLSMIDYYPSDSYVFSSHGYELHISDELVADAFGELPQQERDAVACQKLLETVHIVDGERNKIAVHVVAHQNDRASQVTFARQL